MIDGTNISRPDATNLIENLPDPQAVRERLGVAVREARILRQLLRVTERARRDMPRTDREVAHAA